MRKEILRIIDANLNRSREGLRVCEEVARFILNSKSLSRELKEVRHRITGAAKRIAGSNKVILQSRDSEDDVGKRLNIKSEMKRLSVIDVFEANMERVKESLRVLEEFAKLVDGASSARFSNLRFKAYEIEKRAVRKIASLRNLR